MSKKFCAVLACTNNSATDKSLSWHRFPKSDEELRNEWKRRCGRSDPIKSYHRVCSAHFPPEAYLMNFKEKLMGTPARRYLKPNVFPTLLLDSLSDDHIEETSERSRKKKLLSTPSPVNESATTANRNMKIIAQSKRTCKLNGTSSRTEEIVFEVDETDDKTREEDDDDDCRPLKRRKTSGRSPEKGVFECSMNLTDEEDAVMFQSEVGIAAESRQLHSNNLSSDSSKIITNGDEPSHLSVSTNMSNVRDKNQAWEPTSDDRQHQTKAEKAVIYQENSLDPRKLGKVMVDPIVHMDSVKSIENIFSPNQLKSLMKTKKRIRWTDDEIFEAVKLRFFSLPMYSYLRNQKGYPFPGRSAISRWAKKMKLRGGTLHSVLKILELGESSADAKKCGMKDFCVLSLGEMEVKESIEYDEFEDEIIGPYKRMQVMMASSLTGSWHQTVFVDFDSNITKDTVISMIVELYSIGYYVVCFSSGCSDTSAKLWTDLGATMERPCFPHPVGGGRITVIPDAMHGIRAIRDRLLEDGFEIEGSPINSTPLEFLLDLGVSKLRPYHLQPNEKEIRRTDLALQLVSSSIGTALTELKPGDVAVATSTGNFLKVMSHWFNLMNVATADLTVPFRSAYGLKRLEQDRLLDHVKTVISIMNIGNRSDMQSFQIGIIMSCNGLPLLFDEMKKRFNLEYIKTQRLNHTTLEGLFSFLCSDFSLVPTPVASLNKLQSNFFNEHIGPVTEKHSTFTFVMKRAKIKLHLSEPPYRKLLETINSSLLDTIFSTPKFFVDNKLTPQCLFVIAEKINEELGSKYPQFRKFPNPSGRDPDEHEPTAYFLGNLVKMEKAFVSFTRGLIAAECDNIMARLIRSMKSFSDTLPAEMIQIFVRLRIEIYARSLVPKLSQLVMKRMMHSKLMMALKENKE